MSSELIKEIASDSVIDTVYEWLCKRRRDYSHNDEVWDIRFRWTEFMHRSFKVFDTVGWHGQTLFVRVFSLLQRFSRTNEFVRATTQVGKNKVPEG